MAIPRQLWPTHRQQEVVHQTTIWTQWHHRQSQSFWWCYTLPPQRSRKQGKFLCWGIFAGLICHICFIHISKDLHMEYYGFWIFLQGLNLRSPYLINRNLRLKKKNLWKGSSRKYTWWIFCMFSTLRDVIRWFRPGHGRDKWGNLRSSLLVNVDIWRETMLLLHKN